MNIKTKLLTLLLILSTGFFSFAQETEEAKPKKKKGIKNVVNSVMRSLKKAELTEDQQQAAKTIIEEHAQSLIDARTELNSLVSKEKRQARDAAFKAAKSEGSKYAEALEKSFVAMELSEEELAAYKEAKSNVQTTMTKIKDAVIETLTEEQKSALTKKRKKKSQGEADDQADDDK